jgi:hypothetical protein
MEKDSELFVGLDTSKLKISVAVAEGERNGEVRFFWTFQRCRHPWQRWWPSSRSAVPSSTSATRLAQRDTSCTAKSVTVRRGPQHRPSERSKSS